jgi:hypothetical protein
VKKIDNLAITLKMSCEQIDLTMHLPKAQLYSLPDLGLGTGQTLKSVDKNISCREIYSKESFLLFGINTHGMIIVG